MKEKFYSLFYNPRRISRRVSLQGEIPESGELVRRTARVALPSIIESFLIAVVSMVDTYMVSGLGEYAISAVGLTTQPKFVSLAAFIAISTAVSALVARRRGEGRHQEAGKVLQQALLVSLLLTAVVTLVFQLIAEPAMSLMGSQEDSHRDAVLYLRIITGGMVFQVVTLVINAAQRGVGNTKIAMKTNIASNLVNVFFNYLLIEGRFGFPRLEVAGAAVATVIGTVVSCVMAIVSVSHRDGYLHLFKDFKLRFERAVLKPIVKLGVPTLAEQVFIRIGFIMYFALIARLGTTANAAHHVGMNFIHISFSLAEGLSVAAIAMVGRSLGEGRKDMALIYSSICQRFGLLCSCLVALVYIPFGRQLFSLFVTGAETLALGAQIMKVAAVVVFIQITMIIFISCLRAAGDVKYVAGVGLVSIGIVRPLSAWILCYPMGLGLVGAWMGMLIDQALRLLLSYLRYRKGNWLNIKI